GGGRGDGGKR
ncbi:unnamed protein product, partial [Adineta steineri]